MYGSQRKKLSRWQDCVDLQLGIATEQTLLDPQIKRLQVLPD
jgi:hypothetical protein